MSIAMSQMRGAASTRPASAGLIPAYSVRKNNRYTAIRVCGQDAAAAPRPKASDCRQSRVMTAASEGLGLPGLTCRWWLLGWGSGAWCAARRWPVSRQDVVYLKTNKMSIYEKL
ncbi:hypothetical protein ED208_02910 [Stagnimonas aquatica]|uniref:Uncharacterized protein n=1 Tax=Stagnimonas aquatica TaxID=2689987 RepID=A0A3N0VL95_9GAMM|nr:hypothetical protein ED208_02910 [Stagnimonas aquatica]